jgi:hypothetical protein
MDTSKIAEESVNTARAAEKLVVDTEVELSGPEFWRVAHSTRVAWHGRRNIRLAISENDSDVTYTYQEPNEPAIHTEVVKRSGWKGLCRGRIGKLESWMRETPYGIEDSAGRSIVNNFGSSNQVSPHVSDCLSFTFRRSTSGLAAYMGSSAY